MSPRPPSGDRPDASAQPDARPGSVEAALALALRHSRNAIAEALLAGHALLDAASIALTGRPAAHDADASEHASDAVRAIARMVDGIDALASRLRADDAEATRRLVDALLAALDSEIARWESRARSDPDARAVLRAFLGLRELLWELGLRPEPDAQTAAHDDAANAPSSGKPRKRPRPPRGEAAKTATAAASKPHGRRRVQRVDIES